MLGLNVLILVAIILHIRNRRNLKLYVRILQSHAHTVLLGCYVRNIISAKFAEKGGSWAQRNWRVNVLMCVNCQWIDKKAQNW